MAQVSRMTGIPESTLSNWRKSAWWPPLLGDLRSQYDEELDGKLTGLLHNAVDRLWQAVDSGDTVLVRGKAGVHETRQKPVSGRDLAVISGILFDKRSLLRRLPTTIRADSTKERLEAVARGTFFMLKTAQPCGFQNIPDFPLHPDSPDPSRLNIWAGGPLRNEPL